jgi:hypothetical protein
LFAAAKAVLVILDGLVELGFRVHHERATAGNGFVRRAATGQADSHSPPSDSPCSGHLLATPAQAMPKLEARHGENSAQACAEFSRLILRLGRAVVLMRVGWRSAAGLRSLEKKHQQERRQK